MRKIAIIGSGLAGLVAAHGVRRAGHEVTLYSDRTPEQWLRAWVKDARLADPFGWLRGAVPPTVREPVGRLPSGRVVMPLGDTAVSLDPVGGQGANHGSKMARDYVKAIARADGEGRALDRPG